MFSTKIQAYFFDADPAGIIFYGKIFYYIHAAYENFLKNMKLNKNYFKDENVALPIIHAEADYKSPIKFGELINIQITVTRLKKSSFELHYKIYTNKKDAVATAKTVHVCVDKNYFKKVNLPEDLYKNLEKHKVS